MRKTKLLFDPQVFLARANGGKTIARYRKNDHVFVQGDPADAIYYTLTLH